MLRNFENSNVEILTKVVNRHTFGQTIHALDDPCFIYDIASYWVLSLLFVNHPSSFFCISLFKYRPSSLLERKDIEHLYYKIIAIQSS